MIRPSLAAYGLAVLALCQCQRVDPVVAPTGPSAAASSEAPRASPPPKPAPAPDPEGAVTVEGTLSVTPRETDRKSVVAYRGERFILSTDTERVSIFASDSVPDEALEALAGRRVTVTGVKVAPRAPGPNEQAPLGPDGAPMRRPGGLRAIRVAPLP